MIFVNQSLEGDLLRTTRIQIVNVNVTVWELYTKKNCNAWRWPAVVKTCSAWCKQIKYNNCCIDGENLYLVIVYMQQDADFKNKFLLAVSLCLESFKGKYMLILPRTPCYISRMIMVSVFRRMLYHPVVS
jgi:hypothetical protein